MRRILSMALVLSLGVFFQAGCGGVGVRLGPSGGNGHQTYSSSSWPDQWKDLDSVTMDFTPIIVGAVALLTAAFVFVYFKAKHDRIQYALTPEGERVQILIHAEAPGNAVFLGDIHTKSCSHLDYVKNDLRNHTARLGGDLLVVDNIQQDIYDGQTFGYIGIGRAYKTKGKSN